MSDNRLTVQQAVARRAFLGNGLQSAAGLAALACLQRAACGASGSPAVGQSNPRAKRVIFLTQSGGPSQLELFDNKPGLLKWAGRELPDSVRRGQRLTTMTAGQKQLVMPSRVRFRRCGESGAEISEWLPHLQGVVDELCLVRSLYTDEINHAPAMTKFLTGHQLAGRPSMGAWTSYGLGSENSSLPEYLVDRKSVV